MGLEDLRLQIQNAAISHIPRQKSSPTKRRRSVENRAPVFDTKRQSFGI
jgi:hypothetical protein